MVIIYAMYYLKSSKLLQNCLYSQAGYQQYHKVWTKKNHNFYCNLRHSVATSETIQQEPALVIT